MILKKIFNKTKNKMRNNKNRSLMMILGLLIKQMRILILIKIMTRIKRSRVYKVTNNNLTKNKLTYKWTT